MPMIRAGKVDNFERNVVFLTNFWIFSRILAGVEPFFVPQDFNRNVFSMNEIIRKYPAGFCGKSSRSLGKFQSHTLPSKHHPPS